MNKRHREERNKPFVISNHRIRSNELRVISDEGEQLGILSKNEAQNIAGEKDRAKQARQNSVDIKEVKFRPNIGENDLKMKLKQCQKFIDKGNKVKITIQMRGRENSRSTDVLENFNSQFSENLSGFKFDAPLKQTGNRIMGMLVKDE